MINSLIKKSKKITWNDAAFGKAHYDKNIYRNLFFFNRSKFKRRKWKFLRSWKNLLENVLIKRFSPNLKYMPMYSRLINKTIDIDNIKLNKFRQYLTYKSRLTLITRLRGFFRIRTLKKLKQHFVYKHITTQFNSFDNNFEILLVRLGIVDNIKTARVYIKDGVLKVNNFIRYKTSNLKNYDFVEFSDNTIVVFYQKYIFIPPLRKFKNIYNDYLVKVIDQMDYMCSHSFAKRNLNLYFLYMLPFTFPINYENMSFIYFNFLLKNQWNYFFDFYTIKKFLQYAR